MEINISQYYLQPGTLSDSSLSNNIIGSSDCNNYMPIYAALNHEVIDIIEADTQVVLYPKNIGLSLSSIRSYKDVVESFLPSIGLSTKTFSFRYENISEYVYVSDGQIVDTVNNTLMVLTVKSEYLLNTPYEQLDFVPTEYRLIVSSLLITTPKYKNLLKNLRKHIINPMIEIGVSVLYTGNVDIELYKNNFSLPTFSTPLEMKDYLDNEVSKFLINTT